MKESTSAPTPTLPNIRIIPHDSHVPHLYNTYIIHIGHKMSDDDLRFADVHITRQPVLQFSMPRVDRSPYHPAPESKGYISEIVFIIHQLYRLLLLCKARCRNNNNNISIAVAIDFYYEKREMILHSGRI